MIRHLGKLAPKQAYDGGAHYKSVLCEWRGKTAAGGAALKIHVSSKTLGFLRAEKLSYII